MTASAPIQASGGVPSDEEVAEHLSRLIRIATITPPDQGPLSPSVAATFAELQTELRALYPRVFAAAASVRTAGRAGLLLHLPGGSSEAPLVLMAHQDVVPTPEDWKAEGWQHPPFDGVIRDGWVFGRGALDDKGELVVILEAVESLLGQGWHPEHDLYLSFGADEESYGSSAVEAAAMMQADGVRPWMVLDEGGAVATGAFPGLAGEMAVVGTSEKGVLTLTLTAESGGGHASTPPRHTASGLLAQALVTLERHPHPAAVNEVSVEMFETVAPHLRGPLRFLLSRAGRLRALLARVLPAAGVEMNAMVRTTSAITRLEGSPGDNVLANRASAVVNLRVAVGSTCEEVVARVRRIVGKRIEVRVKESSEPSPVSPSGADPRWRSIVAAIEASYPEAVAVPYVMLAASDARHMTGLSDAVYRFAPLRMSASQRHSVHGNDERVEVESLGRGVAFYRALLTAPRP